MKISITEKQTPGFLIAVVQNMRSNMIWVPVKSVTKAVWVRVKIVTKAEWVPVKGV